MRTLITKELEEPAERGIYFILDESGETYCYIYKIATSTSPWEDAYGTTFTWVGILNVLATGVFYIESIADHDARIRNEALTITYDEANAAIEAFNLNTSFFYDDKPKVLRHLLRSLAESREQGIEVNATNSTNETISTQEDPKESRIEAFNALADSVTRVTVVSENGREYEGWNFDGVQIDLQDDGKTLKILPKGMK